MSVCTLSMLDTSSTRVSEEIVLFVVEFVDVKDTS